MFFNPCNLHEHELSSCDKRSKQNSRRCKCTAGHNIFISYHKNIELHREVTKNNKHAKECEEDYSQDASAGARDDSLVDICASSVPRWHEERSTKLENENKKLKNENVLSYSQNLHLRNKMIRDLDGNYGIGASVCLKTHAINLK